MKQLFHLLPTGTTIVVATSCYLLFPDALTRVNAQSKANNQQPVILLAQADTEAKSTQKSPANSLSEATDAKNLITYNLEFNRSPVVGNRMRLRGVYSEGRLAFTRPRNWKLDKGQVKALIRFQHSPALYASRSNLTVLLNGTSVGSVPLNRKQSQIGQVLLNIPSNLVQDYNELTIVAQQSNSLECSNPNSPDLWTEILPDSKLIFNFQQQPIPLNFSRYPYPVFDELGLDTNQIVYLQPNQVSQTWLTPAARLQASLGRTADFRPMQTSLVSDVSDVKPNQRLVIIGTPSEQPALASWKNLPLKVVSSQILDRDNNPIPEDTGVLLITRTEKSNAPVLIATGNSSQAVAKAVQFLTQPDVRKMGTGQVILVDKLQDTATPGTRQWPRYLPEKNTFQLSEIKTQVNGQPFTDVTVRGAAAPAIDIDFRALPDDRFLRGSSMNLVYSYGPQMNPRTSAIEVLLDGVFIGGARLDSESGANRKNLKVNLPENLVKPNSRLQVFFRMNSREPFDQQNCLQPPDQQLTGTVHSDTSFDLRREVSADLPDLNLLKFGYPLAAPQDLSNTAIVLPQNPTATDVLTLLALSERLGRISQADTVKLDVYTPDSLPETVRKNNNLVGIGTREKFPLPDVFQSGGLNLSQAFSRLSAQATVQTPQDAQGMIKQIISPWNKERVLLALTAQSDTGLERVRQVFNQDPWFFQLKKDTVLISSDQKDPNPYDADAYQLDFFQSAPKVNRIEKTTLLSKVSRLIQENWLLLPLGIVGLSVLLYGISQLYIKRLANSEKK
ncbi:MULTISPECIES: cellulose biosynthesis cyclic di-GMP-binding regulatory protein BcsB [Calothrix]|uniref:Cellulose biosynthesis cyclic di-GMP-binding regulatory protein BcsB n=2 Tax=Calothrix TaxID=1186 RepID=A0ABR8AMC7_9CYAN|nr:MULTISPECIES: cellulose biosynthesis cyclic di-GMP-binding regulatory protein BcsB [Calothrix]MBD2200438.1 cellulose biosynthesis cyclic di-GMP-binding regulatory protein BcsB [Calothrix parietina FACHB-288]MBD2227308.1 cellulose biosynthesis cyclic di-GMP-binding regulatory protein BcsB [Calothrix anomala FACHB-343]